MSTRILQVCDDGVAWLSVNPGDMVFYSGSMITSWPPDGQCRTGEFPRMMSLAGTTQFLVLSRVDLKRKSGELISIDFTVMLENQFWWFRKTSGIDLFTDREKLLSDTQ